MEEEEIDFGPSLPKYPRTEIAEIDLTNYLLVFYYFLICFFKTKKKIFFSRENDIVFLYFSHEDEEDLEEEEELCQQSRSTKINSHNGEVYTIGKK